MSCILTNTLVPLSHLLDITPNHTHRSSVYMYILVKEVPPLWFLHFTIYLSSERTATCATDRNDSITGLCAGIWDKQAEHCCENLIRHHYTVELKALLSLACISKEKQAAQRCWSWISLVILPTNIGLTQGQSWWSRVSISTSVRIKFYIHDIGHVAE